MVLAKMFNNKCWEYCIFSESQPFNFAVRRNKSREILPKLWSCCERKPTPASEFQPLPRGPATMFEVLRNFVSKLSKTLSKTVKLLSNRLDGSWAPSCNSCSGSGGRMDAKTSGSSMSESKASSALVITVMETNRHKPSKSLQVCTPIALYQWQSHPGHPCFV